jgi:hypothetical protein
MWKQSRFKRSGNLLARQFLASVLFLNSAALVAPQRALAEASASRRAVGRGGAVTAPPDDTNSTNPLNQILNKTISGHSFGTVSSRLDFAFRQLNPNPFSRASQFQLPQGVTDAEAQVLLEIFGVNLLKTEARREKVWEGDFRWTLPSTKDRVFVVDRTVRRDVRGAHYTFEELTSLGYHHRFTFYASWSEIEDFFRYLMVGGEMPPKIFSLNEALVLLNSEGYEVLERAMGDSFHAIEREYLSSQDPNVQALREAIATRSGQWPSQDGLEEILNPATAVGRGTPSGEPRYLTENQRRLIVMARIMTEANRLSKNLRDQTSQAESDSNASKVRLQFLTLMSVAFRMSVIEVLVPELSTLFKDLGEKLSQQARDQSENDEPTFEVPKMPNSLVQMFKDLEVFDAFVLAEDGTVTEAERRDLQTYKSELLKVVLRTIEALIPGLSSTVQNAMSLANSRRIEAIKRILEETEKKRVDLASLGTKFQYAIVGAAGGVFTSLIEGVAVVGAFKFKVLKPEYYKLVESGLTETLFGLVLTGITAGVLVNYFKRSALGHTARLTEADLSQATRKQIEIPPETKSKIAMGLIKQLMSPADCNLLLGGSPSSRRALEERVPLPVKAPTSL